MSTARRYIIDDAAKHLAKDLQAVFLRHMLVLRAAGASTVEGSVAACAAYEALGFVVLGSTLASSADPEAGYLTSIDVLAEGLRRRRGELATAVSQTQAKYAARGRS